MTLENKKEKKKIVIKTIVIILLIEFIIGIIGISTIYFFYDSISKTSSGKSEKIVNQNISLKEIKINIPIKKDKDNKKEGLIYGGNLGKIEIYENEKFDIKDLKGIYEKNKKVNFDINLNEIKKQLTLNFLNKNNLLDKYIYSYFKNNSIKNSEDEFLNLMNYGILIKALKKEDTEKYIEEYNKYINNSISTIQTYLESKDFKLLGDLLNKIESDFDLKKIKDNIYGNTGLVTDERFQYVLNKLYDPKYYNNIKNVAKQIPNIDDDLIVSAIAVEQLRFLATDRGYAKNLIKNNKFLTNFTKFSYGLGGIKTNTFNNINHWIKVYNKPLYDRIFKEYVGKVIKKEDPINNIKIISDEVKVENKKPKENKKVEFDEVKIKEILENHYNGTLYVGALLYTIKERWKRNGFSIDDNPGVILTLYNFGNLKTPHANPGIGGSYIKINGDSEKYYFGEIGLIFYNYIKYYIQNK